jgi:tetratricopeptide (TPR) repeat protein
MMASKADGNPFFLEEIVRDLIQAGALVHEPTTGHWRAPREIEKVTLPDTIQGLINARIDRLDDSLKQVVRRAAIIGRQFLYRILITVIDDGRDLDAQLNKLQSVELIKEKQHIPELEYIFKHALAQEAVYEGILLQERREVHARVGAAIESQMTDRIDEFYGLLAYHYSAAEQWEQAQDYLFKAGDQAGRMAADAEAVALYHQAMEAYSRVRGDDWDPFERAQLEHKIGEALFRLGEHDQALSYLERSIARLGQSLPSTKWGTRFALLRAFLSQVGHRLFPRWFLGSMGESPNSETEELFNVALALNWIEIYRDIERYMLVTISTLNTSERAGYAYGSSYLASTLATGLVMMGRRSLAERYFSLAAQYAQDIKPYRPVFYLEFGKAVHSNLLAGELEKSIHHGRRGAEIALGTGDIRSWGSAMDIVGWGLYLQGKLGESIEMRKEMIAVAEEASDSQVLCWGLFGLGATQIFTGQIDQAINNLQRGQEVAEDVPDWHTHMGTMAVQGRAYIVKGEVEKTLATLEDLHDLAFDRGVVFETAELGIVYSEVYLAAAEQAEGKTREDWLKKAGKSCKKSIKSGKNNRPIYPEAMLLMGRYEWLREKPDSAQKWWGKALEEAHNLHESYIEGIIHLEIGKRLREREHLLRAESILEEIGAQFDLAVAREALSSLGES